MDRITDSAIAPVVPHRTALLVLAAGGLIAFAAWQVTGVAMFLEALGGTCL
ncbi:MAG: hypothetical protein ING77_16430 [Rhodocyclaceae bacterium]|nr:hypothetical protein [Rhodocyclaceae bacterium]MCA3076644.1 hypothetical protein [Rhodocyclaceae bacterium]MCA3091431.1 hypothetical protein [Rhodocyclaceae bacterium]MCA3094240.1 hypothetical protein [Rhodocyclaceae bacterium]MCA3098414.1 hypothetical protein [Rhodocyclaceae bacterium]